MSLASVVLCKVRVFQPSETLYKKRLQITLFEGVFMFDDYDIPVSDNDESVIENRALIIDPRCVTSCSHSSLAPSVFQTPW
jgi:hypothetical protein